MFEVREGYDPKWISSLMELHNKTPMERESAEQVGAAFAASFAVVTVWLRERLIGCGRMLSDGQMYASIFDVVVDPDFQKQGVGRLMVERLVAKAPHACVHLTSTFGNEEFYSKVGFRKHKTAMALYPPPMNNSPYLESLERGPSIEQPRLVTGRLVLEPYKESDVEDVFRYASCPEITRYLTWQPHKDLNDSKDFLEWVRSTTNSELGKLFFVFAIRLRESGRVIGSIDFKNVQPWSGQMDYVLGQEHWGKGIMSEAATAVRDWALSQFPELVRLQAYCEPENKASARVMQKIGMEFEGIRKKSFRVKGRIVDLAHYALLR